MWLSGNSLAVSRRPTPVYGGSPYALLAGLPVVRRQLGSINVGSQLIGQGQGAGQGALKGGSEGATIGSEILPGIGTAVGAAIGAVVGALAGAIGKKDPESANFDQAIAIYNAQGLNGILNIADKYLVLAGLFDLKSIHTNIPIYKKYGRMGEQKFVTDLCNLIYLAGQSGKITGNDTPITVMANIVQPWIDSWGYGPMSDPNANMINAVLLGMVAEYLMGGQGLWLDVNGNNPFKSLPTFSLPAAAAPPAAAPPPGSAPPVTPSGGVNPNVIPSATAAAPTPSTNGIIYAGSNTSLNTPDGQWVALPSGAYTLNGVQQASGPPGGSATRGTASITFDGQNTVARNLDGTVYTWHGAWQPVSAAPIAVQSPSPTSTAAPAVPSGYTVTSSTTPDSRPIYLGPGGAYFVQAPSTGTMTPLATYLASLPVAPTTVSANPTAATPAPVVVATPSGQSIDVNALTQALLAQGQSQAQAYQSAISALQSAGVQPAVAQSAAQQAVQTASTVPEASSGVWWIAGLLALVGIGFAFAKPAPKKRRPAMRFTS